MKSQLEDYMGYAYDCRYRTASNLIAFDSDDNFETYYSLLYTLPAFPNVILPFLEDILLTSWEYVLACLYLYLL
jgi:hypothetical protein